MKSTQPLAIALAAVMLPMAAAGAHAATVVYQENFDAFSLGAVNSQFGWSATSGTPSIVTGDAGGSDRVLTGTNASTQGNARNASLFSLSADTSQIIATARMRLRGGNGNRIWFTDSAGTNIFGFGAGYGGFSFVVVTPADVKQFSGNIAGGSALSGTSHAWYDVRFTIDFNEVGDATGLYEVRKDGQGSFTTVVSGLDLNFAATYENPALWTGLFTEMRTTSDQIDDISIAVTVPAPVALPAGLGLIALSVLRRRRIA